VLERSGARARIEPQCVRESLDGNIRARARARAQRSGARARIEPQCVRESLGGNKRFKPVPSDR
jgi:hypothetical protein